MSEFRRDPITGRWVIVAENRSARPNEYPPAAPSSATNCPFCAGHESWTPPEVAAYGAAGRAPNGPGWTVRTVPNKFPSVEPWEGPPEPEDDRRPGRPRPGRGRHEVVVESPEHTPLFPYFSKERVAEVLRMVRGRVAAIESGAEIASLVAFENSGPESGGTLFHPHAQIVGVPEVVPSLREESEGASRLAEDSASTCGFETALDGELRDARRLVAKSDAWTAYVPYASEHPYEVRFVPTRHAASLGVATDGEIDGLTTLLPAVLRALHTIAPGASYNWVSRAFATGRPERAAYHWHLDVLPRLVRPDGFEVGGGIAVNPVAPEAAARELTDALAGRTPSRSTGAPKP